MEPATVALTHAGPLTAKHILHAVAIDPFYDSSTEIVERTIRTALTMAKDLGAKTVAMPALATRIPAISSIGRNSRRPSSKANIQVKAGRQLSV